MRVTFNQSELKLKPAVLTAMKDEKESFLSVRRRLDITGSKFIQFRSHWWHFFLVQSFNLPPVMVASTLHQVSFSDVDSAIGINQSDITSATV